MVRALVLAALLSAGPAALAAECGPLIERARLDELGGALHRSLGGLAAYGESLPGDSHALRVSQLVHELVVLHERLGRVAMLAEIRDAMRHDGERSFVQFKLSHEASVLKLASSRAHASVTGALSGRPGIEEGVARLLEALAQAKSLFAACDSPV
jgi:hypothetical protein